MTSPSPPPGLEELMPCPFCGGTAIIVHDNDWCEPPEWHLSCSYCVKETHATREDAVAAWNHRALTPATVSAPGAGAGETPSSGDAELIAKIAAILKDEWENDDGGYTWIATRIANEVRLAPSGDGPEAQPLSAPDKSKE